jgi:hypothetical protein
LNSNSSRKIATGIYQHFKDQYNNYGDLNDTFEQFLQKHLFFVTVTFRLEKINGWRKDKSVLFKEFGRWNFELNRMVLGSKLHRKTNLQPICYAFIDFEGTRKNGVGDVRKSELPHIHALILVQPRILNRFWSALLRPELRPASMMPPDIRKFDHRLGNLPDLISYSAKGLDRVTDRNAQADLWNIFPAVTGKRNFKKAG